MPIPTTIYVPLSSSTTGSSSSANRSLTKSKGNLTRSKSLTQRIQNLRIFRKENLGSTSSLNTQEGEYSEDEDSMASLNEFLKELRAEYKNPKRARSLR